MLNIQSVIDQLSRKITVFILETPGDWKSRLHKPSPPTRTISKPAPAGFVCIAPDFTVRVACALAQGYLPKVDALVILCWLMVIILIEITEENFRIVVNFKMNC
ncbi:hypothetical protein Nos7107_0627 [Nostoc sp. PCC 7107]|nr:hypothetical protein Nos7107_0627 [Nostoc sp. PCC 7107]